MFLSYIKGISEKISKACRPFGAQTVFSSRNTLKESLTKVEGKTSHDGCEGRCVLNSLCRMFGYLYVLVRLGGHRKSIWQSTGGQ